MVVAHPAAVVLALLALRGEKAGKIQRMVATVFEPASEHGQKGMDELHEQTVNLLSFQTCRRMCSTSRCLQHGGALRTDSRICRWNRW